MFVVFDKFDAPKIRNKNEKSKDFRKNILIAIPSGIC